MLYQITLSYACFGIVVEDGIVVEAAPIGGWMVGKRISYITAWVIKKWGMLKQVEED